MFLFTNVNRYAIEPVHYLLLICDCHIPSANPQTPRSPIKNHWSRDAGSQNAITPSDPRFNMAAEKKIQYV